jgi:hypothetical protein
MREKMKDLELKRTTELIDLIRAQLDVYQRMGAERRESYFVRSVIEETRAGLNKIQSRIEELDEQVNALKWKE